MDEWTAGQVLHVLEKRIDDLHSEIVRELEGFPQEYAPAAAVEALRQQVETVRTDHVHRREVDELSGRHSEDIEGLRSKLDEATGRRSTVYAVVAVIGTLLALLFGFIWQAQITSAQVSDQIQREAPWNKDRPVVENEITQLQAAAVASKLQISKLQTQVQFLCRTRQKVGLPAC